MIFCSIYNFNILKKVKKENFYNYALILSISLHCIFFIIINLNQNAINRRIPIKDDNYINMHTILLNHSDIIPQDNKDNNNKIKEEKTKGKEMFPHPPCLKKYSVKEKQYSHHLSKERNTHTPMTTLIKKMVSDINREIEINAILNKVTGTHTNQIDSVIHSVSNNRKAIPAHCDEIKVYKEKIIQAISEKFYDSDNYIGKTCNFNIHLSPDGKLEYIAAVSGDTELCKAAITSAKLSNLPKITNPKLYDVFQNIILTFSPE